MQQRLRALLAPGQTGKVPCQERESKLHVQGRPGWGLWHGGVETFFQKDLFILQLKSSWTSKRRTKHLWPQIPRLSTAARGKPTWGSERRGSSPDCIRAGPRGNSDRRGSMSAMFRCQLTLIRGSRTPPPNDQTKAWSQRPLDCTGHFAGTISPPSSLPGEEVVFINKITLFNPVTSLLSTDTDPRSLGLTKMPWFSGGCPICFHFLPWGCCKNTFQGMHVPGACFCYLAEYSSFQYSSKCAREGPALMHYSGLPWLFGSEAPCSALPCWDFCARPSPGAVLCRAVVYACGHPPEAAAAPEWDKAQFRLTCSSDPSRAKQNTR